MIKKGLLILGLFTINVQSTKAMEIEENFEKAQSLYRANKLSSAIKEYKELAEKGHKESLRILTAIFESVDDHEQAERYKNKLDEIKLQQTSGDLSYSRIASLSTSFSSDDSEEKVKQLGTNQLEELIILGQKAKEELEKRQKSKLGFSSD